MSTLNRFRDWWLGQYRSQRGLGKAIWVGGPALVALVFGCCFCSLALSTFAPDPTAAEPTAALAERAAGVDLAQTEEPTDEPRATSTEAPATPTRAPMRTAAPTATDEPASVTPRPSTATIAPSATVMPATATRPPATATATAAPPTATRPAATVTSVPPPPATRPPATAAPLPTATAALSTAPPQPTATQPPAAASGDVVISSIRYDGDVPQVESDEYAVVTNRGGGAVNLAGWRLNAGEPDQNFTFPPFDLQPGQSCRVYTNESHPESCGFSFGRGDAIWRNSNDCGYLYNAEGVEVSRFCWN